MPFVKSLRFWARLRIVCHILRDEISAAELTRDLLQSTDYKDPSYFTLLSQMIRKKSQTSSKRLPRPPALRNDDDALIYYMRDYVAGTLPRPATSPAIDEGPNAENQTPDEQARDNQTPD